MAKTKTHRAFGVDWSVKRGRVVAFVMVDGRDAGSVADWLRDEGYSAREAEAKDFPPEVPEELVRVVVPPEDLVGLVKLLTRARVSDHDDAMVFSSIEDAWNVLNSEVGYTTLPSAIAMGHLRIGGT